MHAVGPAPIAESLIFVVEDLCEVEVPATPAVALAHSVPAHTFVVAEPCKSKVSTTPAVVLEPTAPARKFVVA